MKKYQMMKNNKKINKMRKLVRMKSKINKNKVIMNKQN